MIQLGRITASPSKESRWTGVKPRAHRVVQAVDLQHHGLGPLVGGAQEELSLTPAWGGGFGFFGLCVARALQDLIDFWSQQLGFTWGCAPEESKSDIMWHLKRTRAHTHTLKCRCGHHICYNRKVKQQLLPLISHSGPLVNKKIISLTLNNLSLWKSRPVKINNWWKFALHLML